VRETLYFGGQKRQLMPRYKLRTLVALAVVLLVAAYRLLANLDFIRLYLLQVTPWEAILSAGDSRHNCIRRSDHSHR
jgi:hypothetical protein